MHQSMSASRDQVMPCTLFDDADIHYWQPGQDITGRIIRAIVAGCRAEPGLNAWYDGDKLERVMHENVDLAMAVDTPDGLIVPVLRNISERAARTRQACAGLRQNTRAAGIGHHRSWTLPMMYFFGTYFQWRLSELLFR
jgi:2-oxoisovalerate dehydrogenase E2 component (dihydrolipoyl transacylase)